MCRVSSSAHSNNLKLMKTPKPIKLGPIKKPGFIPKNQKPIKLCAWAFCNKQVFKP